MTIADATIEHARHRQDRQGHQGHHRSSWTAPATRMPSRTASTRSSAELERTDSDFDREKLQERLAKLSGGVAVLQAWALPPRPSSRRRRAASRTPCRRPARPSKRASSPAAAWRCVDALPALDAVECADKDEEVGVAIIRKALEAPMRAIAQNAGFEGSVVVEKVKGMKKGEGLNCANGEYGDMIAMGVNDPVKVTRTALQSAASVAGPHPHHRVLHQRDSQGRSRFERSCWRWRWRRYGRHDVIFADAAGPAGGRLAVQASRMVERPMRLAFAAFRATGGPLAVFRRGSRLLLWLSETSDQLRSVFSLRFWPRRFSCGAFRF